MIPNDALRQVSRKTWFVRIDQLDEHVGDKLTRCGKVISNGQIWPVLAKSGLFGPNEFRAAVLAIFATSGHLSHVSRF